MHTPTTLGDSSTFRLPIASGGDVAVQIDEPHASHGDLAALYLHGLGSTRDGEKAELFRLSFLGRGVAFCALDFRGHGQSGGSMLDLSLSRNLEDVEATRAELTRRGYSRIVLVGSSMGGLTALWEAALRPDGLVAAAHLAPALGLEKTFTRELGVETVASWQREGRLAITHELGTWDIGWSFVEDLRSYDFERLCSLYRTPTLLFQGKLDTSVPWRRVVEFATEATGGEIEVHLFADAEHRMLDRLPRLAALMREFLTARGVLPGAFS